MEATPIADDAQPAPRPQRDDRGGDERQRPHDAGRLDRHACDRQQQRERGIARATRQRPAPQRESSHRVIGRHRKIGVAGECDVHVGERQRRDEPCADHRAQRRCTRGAQQSVHADPERDGGEPPRQIHQRIVPAPQRKARPDLPQRNGRGVVGRGVEPRGAVGGEPLLGMDERHHPPHAVPDASLGRPLHPRIPRVQRDPEHFEQQQDEAQHHPSGDAEPQDLRGAGWGRPRLRGRVGRAGGARQSGRRRRRGARGCGARRAPSAPGDHSEREGDDEQRQRDRDDGEAQAHQRHGAHPKRQHESAGEESATRNPRSLARVGSTPTRRAQRGDQGDAEQPGQRPAGCQSQCVDHWISNSAPPWSSSLRSAAIVVPPSQRRRCAAASYCTPRRW